MLSSTEIKKAIEHTQEQLQRLNMQLETSLKVEEFKNNQVAEVLPSLREEYKELKSMIKKPLKSSFDFTVVLKANLELDFNSIIDGVYSQNLISDFFDYYNPEIRVMRKASGFNSNQSDMLDGLISEMQFCEGILEFAPKDFLRKIERVKAKMASIEKKCKENGIDWAVLDKE